MPQPIPPELLLALKQHQGEPARPVVQAGDNILKYQLLAEAASSNSVNLHAPTSGTVTAIEEISLGDAMAEKQIAIRLECDGKDSALALNPVADYRALSNLELLELLKQAGICGLGGAGFPSARKISLAIEYGIETLIINAAECEPYISADEALLREYPGTVVEGAEILQAITLAPRCVIAIENNKRDAIASLKTALAHSSVELLEIPAKYPAGSERQLIQVITGKEVAADCLPVESGILVQNAGTARAIRDCILEGKPCISRITTLTGNPLQTPKNFEVLIGTPVSFLFELCGIDSEQHSGTIVGGSLMGNKLHSTEVPVNKTSNCLIATCEQDFPPPHAAQACIRCGHCADACPARLLPQQLYTFSRSRDLEQLISHGLNDCIECGACAYVCPSHIPLLDYYRASKEELQQELAQGQQSAYWQERFQFHQYRIKKEKEEAVSSKPARKTKKAKEENTESDKTFSREQARAQIADAVSRVKARKKNIIYSSKEDDS